MLDYCASGALVAIVTHASLSSMPAEASSRLLRWHAALACAGVCGCLSLGVRALRRREARVRRTQETRAHSRLVRHALLNFTALAQTALSAGLAWAARGGVGHLASWHGRLGAAATVALTLQCVAGLLLRLCFHTASKRRLACEFAHSICGGATFVTASAAVGSGLFTDWFLGRSHPAVLLAGVTCLHLLALSVIRQIRDHYF